MATAASEALESVERRRVQLQDNVDKLQKALMHWSTWEAEYQALKEELQQAGDPSAPEMLQICRDLDHSLVNEKELQDLLGKDLPTKRTANQVVDMISRRIDYVQQNSSTVEKQLDAAEKKLAGAEVLLEPGVENEEGLPMMDIEEELDEDGNEISSSVNQTGKGAAEIVEALRKAGMYKAGKEKDSDTTEDASGAKSIPAQDTSGPATDKASGAFTGPEVSTARPLPAKKSVSFSEDTKPDPAEEKLSRLQSTGYNDELADFNFTRGTKVIELDDDDQELAAYPIIPQDETPEAAELRRQMLQYGLSEVGQVVAELDLDHPTVEYSDDDEVDDEDYDSDESEEEDEYGRSTRPAITEDYKRQMMELEKKLNARMLENVGPRPDVHPLAEHADDVRQMRIRKDEEFDEQIGKGEDSQGQAESKKKGVRFADNLDISEASQSAPVETPRQPSKPVPTMSDTIVERSGPSSEAPAAPSKPAKVSRFKSARASLGQPPATMLPTPAAPQQPPVPSGPEGRTLATTVVERAAPSSGPQAPDEFDPNVINREIQTEYHKMRNRFIQQQGGFKASEEDEEDPIVEERDGKPKKVSRFKAAKLKAEGL